MFSRLLWEQDCSVLLKTYFSCHPVQPPSRVWNVTWWHSIPTVSLGKHYFVETISRVHRNWNNTKENKTEDRRLIHLSEQQCRLSDILIQLVHSNVFLWYLLHRVPTSSCFTAQLALLFLSNKGQEKCITKHFLFKQNQKCYILIFKIPDLRNSVHKQKARLLLLSFSPLECTVCSLCLC